MYKPFSFRLILGAAAALALGALPNSVRAGEHPEHPSASRAEHPTQAAAAKSAIASQPVTLDDVARFIEAYVKQSSPSGAFTIHDNQAGKDLHLKLDHVHRNRLSKIGPETFFVCADLADPTGKIYDLDFFVEGKTRASLKVLPGKTTIHKEAGKPRYTWRFDRQAGVWVRDTIPAQPAASRQPEHPAGHEHPEHPE